LRCVILTVDYPFEYIPASVYHIFHELLCGMLIQTM
jgi:hypothetical protein